MKVHTESNPFESLLRSLASLVAIAVLAAGGLAHAQTKTPEENNSRGIYQIKADKLYARYPGVTGLNVTAAILDTGIFSHSEFGSRLLTGYNAFDGSTNTTDRYGHGTHVAGIVGAGKDNPATKGMFGVAYNANLLPVKVLDDKGWGTSTSVANGIQYAVNQRKLYLGTDPVKLLTEHHPLAPFVINLSLGGGFSSTDPAVPALKNAVNAGMVVAAAAALFGRRGRLRRRREADALSGARRSGGGARPPHRTEPYRVGSAPGAAERGPN